VLNNLDEATDRIGLDRDTGFDAKWGGFVIDQDHFVKLVYAGL
jgi:hypothetical protein